jgi:hypothetical protein
MQREKIKKKYKLLSFQPFSISGNGGGARILRRLFEIKKDEICIFSLTANSNIQSDTDNEYTEIKKIIYPLHRKWHKNFIYFFISYIRDNVFFFLNSYLITKTVKNLEFEILHIVDHGNYKNTLTNYAIANNKPIWVSFHDHPLSIHNTFLSIHNTLESTKKLWVMSDKRIVISDEMGKNYCKNFGKREYIIVTDGLLSNEISVPNFIKNKVLYNIYFAGLLHVDYYPLFKSFHETLNLIAEELGIKFIFTLRGTQKMNFISNTDFLDYEYLPFTIEHQILKNDIEKTDILYLPIKFSNEYFYKYSMSTKMVGYLGAPGTIFYHGPKDAAVSLLLSENNSAALSYSLNLNEIRIEFLKIFKLNDYSKNAKILAMNQFNLYKNQNRFWE